MHHRPGDAYFEELGDLIRILRDHAPHVKSKSIVYTGKVESGNTVCENLSDSISGREFTTTTAPAQVAQRVKTYHCEYK